MTTGDTILVVEDDPASRSGLMIALTEAGYSVLTAQDGQQALNLLERGIRPRLIVTDLTMPRVAGVDLLKDLRSDLGLRRIPIIVTTGWAPDHMRGVIADVILHKPLDVKELIHVVGRLLDSATTDV